MVWAQARPGLLEAGARLRWGPVCPVTSRKKGYPFEVELPAGLPVAGVILSDHLRSFDRRTRRAEFIGHAPTTIVAEVTARASTLLMEEE